MTGSRMIGDASRDVSSIAATHAVVVLIVLLITAGGAAIALSRRRSTSWSALEWFVGLSTLALVVAVTLFRYGFALHFDVGSLLEWSSDGMRKLSRDPLDSSQFVLNVALFVPAGVAWTILTRRPLLVVAGLAAGSLLIECVQAVTGAGANDVADIVANSIGAVGGAGIALARGAPARASSWSPRRRFVVGVAVFVAVGILVSAWVFGASRRQNHVAAQLRAAFVHTTRTDALALLESDPERVFGAIRERADGTQYLDDALVVRYPATFFSLHRCVYVVWTDTSVSFDKASGDDCTRLLG